MNCDQAFENLIDPDLCDGPELQAHLQHCPRCRQMQQILEPALGLFSPAESEDLDHEATRANGSEGQAAELNPFLTPEAVRLAEQTARSLVSQAAPRRNPSRWRSLAGLACVAVGVLFAAVALSGVHQDPHATSSRALLWPANSERCTWQISGDPGERVSASPKVVVLSCVRCHLADGPDQRNESGLPGIQKGIRELITPDADHKVESARIDFPFLPDLPIPATVDHENLYCFESPIPLFLRVPSGSLDKSHRRSTFLPT